jgi:hypothetical protein
MVASGCPAFGRVPGGGTWPRSDSWELNPSPPARLLQSQQQLVPESGRGEMFRMGLKESTDAAVTCGQSRFPLASGQRASRSQE